MKSKGRYNPAVAMLSFAVRWVLMSIGLWISVRLFGHENFANTETMIITFLVGGLIFSVVNAVIKPILMVLSLPFILVTLGIFILVINGLMIYFTLNLLPNIHMSFSGAIVSGFVLSLINYLISNVNEVIDDHQDRRV
jgi:putative membrane protein